jgi:hypothetical protein
MDEGTTFVRNLFYLLLLFICSKYHQKIEKNMLQVIYKLDLVKFHEYRDYCPHQLPESCETYDVLISRKTEVLMSGTSLGTAKLRKYLRKSFHTKMVK